MKTLDVIADLVSSDAPLDAAARQKLSRQVHTLKELAAKMRVVPHPWTLDGRTEVSILGELELCQALGHAILRDEKEVFGALARFDFRFEAIVRCTFAYLGSREGDAG